MSSTRDLRVVFDTKLMKVGCVLLQAMMGGLSTDELHRHFDPKHWFVTPTPDMALYAISQEELKLLGQTVRRLHGGDQHDERRAKTRTRRAAEP